VLERRPFPKVLAFLVTGLSASTAHAAGVEDTVGGTVGLGRAAHFARVNDFMATWQNPANLAVVPRNELGLELRLPFLQGCFDRKIDPNVDYKQPGAYDGFQGTESFGKVCNEAHFTPTGNLGWAQSFEGKWGYGVGLFTPAGVGTSKYGEDTIVTWYPSANEQYTPTNEGAEAPNRQLGLERRALTAYLMVGLGAQPIPQLRLGLSGGIGFAQVYAKSVVSVLGGTFRDQEVVNELSVTDWAVPRGNASVVVTPIPSIDVFGVVTYQGDIRAEGTSTLTANGIEGAPLKKCGDAKPGTHCELDGVKLDIPLATIEATFGVRYAMKRNASKPTLDPMTDEVFDLEVDLSWAQTSNVDQYSVQLHDKTIDDPTIPRIQFGNADDASFSYVRYTTGVPKHWKDTWSVRGGGDVQILPGKLSARAGVSWASSAVPVKYMNIDYWAIEKLGVHVGASMRFGRFLISAAYAHLFYQEVEVAVGTGGVKDIATIDEAKSTGVNEGSYIASQDIFALQLNAAF
jgi:long-subunit fatty acid transport protein